MKPVDRERLALTALMTGAGVTHLAVPRWYDPMVPRWLPGRGRGWIFGSGLVELAVAVALAARRSRRAGGLAAAVLLAIVFPADIQLARDGWRRPVWQRLAGYVRLPLQLPLIWWGLRVARASGPEV